jgi:hypothetical protein
LNLPHRLGKQRGQVTELEASRHLLHFAVEPDQIAIETLGLVVYYLRHTDRLKPEDSVRSCVMDEQPAWQSEGVPLRLDPDALSADSSLSAFLAGPNDAPVYYGFPMLEQSRTDDGWCFGTISEPDCSEGRDWGDAFVVAPDGSRAGIIWDVEAHGMKVSVPPDEGRWGVFHVGFARRVHNETELLEQLREWLPELRRLHLAWKAERSS